MILVKNSTWVDVVNRLEIIQGSINDLLKKRKWAVDPGPSIGAKNQLMEIQDAPEHTDKAMEH
ncbi:MAG: hypothetical protein NTY70_08165 [Burkholderiales bacterium]|nr:hypothetical protein [Burkholderiales bacterium]